MHMAKSKTQNPGKNHTATLLRSLAKQLDTAMKDGIDDVIDGKREKLEVHNITPSMVEKYLEPLGWEKGELETNGWQYDWWLPFTKDGKSFTASGSGYDGWFLFSKTEE